MPDHVQTILAQPVNFTDVAEYTSTVTDMHLLQETISLNEHLVLFIQRLTRLTDYSVHTVLVYYRVPYRVNFTKIFIPVLRCQGSPVAGGVEVLGGLICGLKTRIRY